MKKEMISGLAAATLLLLLLTGLAAYLHFSGSRSSLAPDSRLAESEADAVLESLHASTKESNMDPERGLSQSAAKGSGTNVQSAPQLLIWVGDSRTVGMQNAMKNDDLYIAAAGEGFRWFEETGCSELEAAISNHPDTPVILNLGVNDYDNLERYLACYQKLVEAYPQTPFYFLSVNPIDPELCLSITNEEIAGFNAQLKAAFPEQYIDSFTWMRVQEILPFDGIHYTKEDYRSLHEYVTERLAKMNEKAQAGE